jgi:hypothetical protein
MEQLVEEKVDAFWKGLENVALKRGEVRRRLYFRGPGYILFKISVTLSKKDQRKAWLGITTYEVCQHSIRCGFTVLRLTSSVFEYRKKLHGNSGALCRPNLMQLVRFH